jgi:hypothetical protein
VLEDHLAVTCRRHPRPENWDNSSSLHPPNSSKLWAGIAASALLHLRRMTAVERAAPSSILRASMSPAEFLPVRKSPTSRRRDGESDRRMGGQTGRLLLMERREIRSPSTCLA